MPSTPVSKNKENLKVILVSPVSKSGNGGFILGLAYISAMLKKQGYTNITGFDLMYQQEKDFSSGAQFANLVGFYCTTRTFKEVRRLSVAVKERNPDCLVVVGGPHPTLMPDEVIAIATIDVVGIGEGEYTILEIIKQLTEGSKNFSGINGICWKNEGRIIRNPDREIQQDLDALPFPDWELFDHKNYHTDLATPIASRGCPYGCINCMPALSQIAGPYRRRSVGNVIAELTELKKRYGLDHVFFQDNDISVSRKWLRNLCDRLIADGLRIRWHALCRVNALDQDLICRMKEAGCIHINIGAESGSQRVIGLLNKKIDLEQVRRVVDWCNLEGLETTVFFMIGIPGETIDEMKQTIDFASNLGADDLMISVAQPVPYTNFEKICKDQNWLLTDNPDDFDTPDDSGGMKCWIKTDQWSPEDLPAIKTAARKILRKKKYTEIDNKFLFRNFRSVIQKRDRKQFFLMLQEQLRLFKKNGKINHLVLAGYFIGLKGRNFLFRKETIKKRVANPNDIVLHQ